MPQPCRPEVDAAAAVGEAVERHRLLEPGDAVVVGFSGGADSLALLHILRRLAPELRLRLTAAHLNHMLRGAEADADARFAEAICRDWGIAIVVERRDVARVAADRGLAIEEAARQVRYGFLGRVAHEAGAAAVAVAHNADDQVETVLMHFLRGAGLAGLRGMLPSLPLADLRLAEGPVGEGPRLIRPLLDVPRAAIEAYCREHGLSARFDRSNLDTTYFRNRLRHELIPCLETYNPNIREVVRRTARVLAADHDYLSAERDRAWEAVVEEADDGRVVLRRAGFLALHESLRRALVRRAIARVRPSLRDVDLAHVDLAIAAVEQAAGAGARATLPGGLMLVTGYDRFAIAREGVEQPIAAELPQLPDEEARLPVPVPGRVELGDGWRLATERRRRRDLPPGALEQEHRWLAYLDAAACREGLVLRARRQGETMQPLGMGGRRKKVNEVMINLKIPAAYRRRYPLLACDGPLWLPGYRLDHRARVTEATECVVAARMEKA